mgnify:CR=1 FL=1
MADPTLPEQYALLVEHYHAMQAHYGAVTGVNMARKHLGWYTKGLHGSADFRNKVNFIDDPDAVLASLAEFYGRAIEHQLANGADSRPERRAAA